MASILIIGESGSGKSTSLRNLNPKETMVFSALGKGLPFKNSRVNYTVYDKGKNPKGNLIVTSSAKGIAGWLQHISDNRPDIKTCIIDDSTFLSAKELDRRRDETGYTKFSDIAHDFLHLSEVANTLRGDLNTYFLYHATTEGDGILEKRNTKALSHGKMIQEKLASVEAQFEIVLLACKITDKDNNLTYKFKTKDADSTVKSPMDLFDSEYIDNDLEQINDRVKCYYEADCEDLENSKQVK